MVVVTVITYELDGAQGAAEIGLLVQPLMVDVSTVFEISIDNGLEGL